MIQVSLIYSLFRKQKQMSIKHTILAVALEDFSDMFISSTVIAVI